MAEKRGKILVIRGGAIGDFILTLPAIAALRETFPETHLELLGYPFAAELARAAGIIDASRSIEARPLARFFARNAQLDPEWSGYFDSFHMIVSYLYDPDDIFKTNIGRASKAQFIQAQHRPDETQDVHATEVFLKPLEKLAIYGPDPIPKLRLPPDSSRNGSWIAAHPGSGSPKKNWPEKQWRELLTRICETSNLLLIVGEAEAERVQRIRAALPPDRVRVAENLSLSQVARLLSGARAFVGHDSGITHLAAAVGVPTLILWGPSNERIWRPLNPNAQLLKTAEGLESLNVEAVLQQLRALIA